MQNLHIETPLIESVPLSQRVNGKVCLEIYIYIIPMISIVLFFRIRIVLNQTALCECEIQDIYVIANEP